MKNRADITSINRMRNKINLNSKLSRIGIDLGLLTGLMIVTVIIFGQVRHLPFLHISQNPYNIKNLDNKTMLTAESIEHCFVPVNHQRYQPLVRLSHLLDERIWGNDEGGHHLSHLLLHLINISLLFIFLRTNTVSRWRSYLITACLALHPINVEPVVWIASRETLLGAMFALITLLAYANYRKNLSYIRYFLFLVCFTGSLMCDMMFIGLPFVLLLLDFWPFGGLYQLPVQYATCGYPKKHLSFLLKEKVLPIGLSIVFLALNLQFAANFRIIEWLGTSFFTPMADYSLNGYLHYMAKMVWPFHLIVFYPYPEPAAGVAFGLSCLATGGFIVFAIFRFKNLPFLLTGLCWYVFLLIPSLWFAAANRWALADHHAYLPLVGLYICITWGVNHLIDKWPAKPVAASILGAIIYLGSASLSWQQIQYWANDITLLEHTTKNKPFDNDVHLYLGTELQANNKIDLAASHYMQYLEKSPENSEVRIRLCKILMKQGRIAETIAHYQLLLDKEPHNALVHNLMGIALETQGEIAAASKHYRAALDFSPENAEAYYNCGNVFLANRKTSKAINYYLNALRYDPGHEKAYFKLGMAFIRKSKNDLAVRYFQMALQIKPDDEEAQYQLGTALVGMGCIEEAITHFNTVTRLNPARYDAHTQWGIALALRGRADEAINQFETALRIRPNDVSARNNLQIAQKAAGDIARKIAALEKKLRDNPNNPELNYRLGLCLYKTGHLNKAETQLKKVLVIQPDFTPALYTLAKLYTDIESYSNAIDLYRNYLLRHPDFYEAHYHLARLYSLQGDDSQARDWLRKAIEAGFKDWRRILLTPELKDIRREFKKNFTPEEKSLNALFARSGFN